MLKSKSAWKVTRSWRSERSDGGRSKHVARSYKQNQNTFFLSLLFSHLFPLWILHDAVVSFFSSVLLFGGRACFK